MTGRHVYAAPICLAEPQPGDITCIPIAGGVGAGISFAQWLAGDRQGRYDHAEVYVGQADRYGPFGYTYSAYPDNGKPGHTGKRPLPCPPAELPGSIWSSGILDLSPIQRKGIVDWCEGHPDVRYSWLDYEALVLYHLHVPSARLRAFISSTQRMICSQYTDAALDFGGNYHLFTDDRWPGDVTPGDIGLLLLSHVVALG